MAVAILMSIVGIIAGYAALSLFGGWVLQRMIKVVLAFKPAYLHCYLISFVGSLATYAIGLLISLLVGTNGSRIDVIGMYCASIALSLVLHSWLIGTFIAPLEGGTIGYKKGALISICYLGIFFIIWVIVAAPFFFMKNLG